MGRKSSFTQAKADAVIYGLCDGDGPVRYVGKARDPAQRLKDHMREVRRPSPLYSWISSLRRRGRAPNFVVLEECTSGEWKSAERRWISHYRAQGPLLNLADGGDEPVCPLEVLSANGRNTALKRKTDPFQRWLWEAKKTIAAGLKRGLVREETKEKLRYAARKRPDLFGCWAHI